MSAVPILGVDVSKVATSLTEAGVPGYGFAVGQRYVDEDGNTFVLCSTATDINASAGAAPVKISADNYVVAAATTSDLTFGWLDQGQDTEDTTVKYVWVKVAGSVMIAGGVADASLTAGAWYQRALTSGDIQAIGATNDTYAIAVDDTAASRTIFIP